MTNGIAAFGKVPFDEYMKALKNSIGPSMTDFDENDRVKTESVMEDICKKDWEDIKMPKRATAGSAGYDFYAPQDFVLYNGAEIVIPTGINVTMNPGWMLQIFPRSGLGFKYGLQLANTVGIIDSDYIHADNYGHIMLKLSLPHKRDGGYGAVTFKKGDRIAQGIFVQYGIIIDDAATGERSGGFGSTGE